MKSNRGAPRRRPLRREGEIASIEIQRRGVGRITGAPENRYRIEVTELLDVALEKRGFLERLAPRSLQGPIGAGRIDHSYFWSGHPAITVIVFGTYRTGQFKAMDSCHTLIWTHQGQVQLGIGKATAFLTICRRTPDVQIQEIVVSVSRADGESRIAAWQRKQRALSIDLVHATSIAIAERAIQIYFARCPHQPQGTKLGLVPSCGHTDIDRPIVWQREGNARRYQEGRRLGRVVVIGCRISNLRLHVTLSPECIELQFDAVP